MQSAMMQILYKGIFRWFLKLIVGVQFPDTRFLQKEGQFIILANHNSHLDTLSLLSSLPGNLNSQQPQMQTTELQIAKRQFTICNKQHTENQVGR